MRILIIDPVHFHSDIWRQVKSLCDRKRIDVQIVERRGKTVPLREGFYKKFDRIIFSDLQFENKCRTILQREKEKVLIVQPSLYQTGVQTSIREIPYDRKKIEGLNSHMLKRSPVPVLKESVLESFLFATIKTQ